MERVCYGRSPHGERGLKYCHEGREVRNASRSPHGERGLKYPNLRLRQRSHHVALLMESVD